MNTPLHRETSSTFVSASTSTSTRYRDRFRDRDSSKHESSYRSYKAFRCHLFQQQQQQQQQQGTGSQKHPSAMGNKNKNKKASISINVIADNQDVIVPLPNTIYDPTLSHSLLTKAAAVATQGQIKIINSIGSTNQNQNQTQTITLRWHYASGLQSWQETFYVVDSILPEDVDDHYSSGEVDAMLRGDIDVKPVADEDDNIGDGDGEINDAAGAVVAQAMLAFPTFQGKYKKGEKEERERKEKEMRERYERELLRDKEAIRKGIEAAKKKIKAR